MRNAGNRAAASLAAVQRRGQWKLLLQLGKEIVQFRIAGQFGREFLAVQKPVARILIVLLSAVVWCGIASAGIIWWVNRYGE